MTSSPNDLQKPLTSIRFFAAMAVVMFHSGSTWVKNMSFMPWPIKHFLSNGYMGVTFFFVLSGFILQFVYGGKNFSIRRYVVARIARIYPVYLVALLILLAFNLPFDWRAVPQFFLLQSWPINDDFDNWNMPAWTLSVELLFYLSFPIISVLAQRSLVWWIVVVIAASAFFIVCTGSSAIWNNKEPLVDFETYVPVPLIRFPEFILGVFVGETYRRTSSSRIKLPVGLIIFTMLVTISIGSGKWLASAVTLFSALIFFAVAHNSESLTARVLSWKPIVLLGASSYALYLMQLPIRRLLNAIVGDGRTAALIQYPILLTGAVLLFLFYEEPTREWIRSTANMRAPATAAV